jgi:Asp/Glu/Hydantoin racemase
MPKYSYATAWRNSPCIAYRVRGGNGRRDLVSASRRNELLHSNDCLFFALMLGSFYPKVFSREGIDLVIPDSDDREFVHDKYMNELVQGTFLPETRSELLHIVERMADGKGADSVLLAGTELPLILKDKTHRGIPLIDTMRVHAAAAVAEMLRQD